MLFYNRYYIKIAQLIVLIEYVSAPQRDEIIVA